MLQARFQHELPEAGCDEAGRGSLAGPVFVAAVLFPPHFSHPDLNDSKLLSPKKRDHLRQVIEREALAYSVKMGTVAEIDQKNILRTSVESMHACIQSLPVSPGLVLIDGNYFIPMAHFPHRCIVGGDRQFMSIAAASILAKTYRDAYMMDLHAAYPAYGWDRNKGYPTYAHRKALADWGPSPEHRKSFTWKQIPDQVLVKTEQ